MAYRPSAALAALAAASLLAACAPGRGPATQSGMAAAPTAAPAPSRASEAVSADARPARSPDVIYVPTPQEVVEAMLGAARVGPNDVLYDLGSGDGRIPITAARRFGTRGVGFDIDPRRIAEARANAERAKVADRVNFVQADLFEQDLSQATVITLYLLPSLNMKLRPRLLALKPGTRIVSHDFDMGDWAPEQTIRVGNRNVYMWTVPARR